MTASAGAAAATQERAGQLARVLLIRSRPARHGGLLSRSAHVTPYRPLVRAVQRATFGAVPPVAVVLKLVLMPGDTRPLDCGALVIIHVPSSPPHLVPAPVGLCARSPSLSQHA